MRLPLSFRVNRRPSPYDLELGVPDIEVIHLGHLCLSLDDGLMNIYQYR